MCLNSYSGRVAEWFKAPVLKVYGPRIATLFVVLFAPIFRGFTDGAHPRGAFQCQAVSARLCPELCPRLFLWRLFSLPKPKKKGSGEVGRGDLPRWPVSTCPTARRLEDELNQITVSPIIRDRCSNLVVPLFATPCVVDLQMRSAGSVVRIYTYRRGCLILRAIQLDAPQAPIRCHLITPLKANIASEKMIALYLPVNKSKSKPFANAC